MADLTKLARGEDCQIRVPGYCRCNSESTVWCHLRMIGISGLGLKSPDVLGAFGCQVCHDIVDNRSHPHIFTYEERRSLLLEGVARTLYLLVKRGILKW